MQSIQVPGDFSPCDLSMMMIISISFFRYVASQSVSLAATSLQLAFVIRWQSEEVRFPGIEAVEAAICFFLSLLGLVRFYKNILSLKFFSSGT